MAEYVMPELCTCGMPRSEAQTITGHYEACPIELAAVLQAKAVEREESCDGEGGVCPTHELIEAIHRVADEISSLHETLDAGMVKTNEVLEDLVCSQYPIPRWRRVVWFVKKWRQS